VGNVKPGFYYWNGVKWVRIISELLLLCPTGLNGVTGPQVLLGLMVSNFLSTSKCRGGVDKV